MAPKVPFLGLVPSLWVTLLSSADMKRQIQWYQQQPKGSHQAVIGEMGVFVRRIFEGQLRFRIE